MVIPHPPTHPPRPPAYVRRRVLLRLFFSSSHYIGGLSLAVEGPSKAEISCHDNKDGTVAVSYLPTAPGEYKITVKFGDKHIKGSPYNTKVTGKLNVNTRVYTHVRTNVRLYDCVRIILYTSRYANSARRVCRIRRRRRRRVFE